MASYTAPTLHATGDDLAVTDYNGVANNTTFLYQAPYFNYYNSVSTSLTNNTYLQVSLTLDFSGYGWSLSSNNAVVPLTGIYSIQFAVTGSTGAGTGVDYLQAQVYQNGTAVLVGNTVPSYSVGPTSTGAGILKCTAGDTIGLWAGQSSGGTMQTSTASTSTYLSGFFVGSE